MKIQENNTKQKYRSLRAALANYPIIFILLLAIIAVTGCSTPNTAASDNTAETDTDTTAASEPDYAGKRIIWIDSYHAEYEWSAAVEEGLRSVLDNTGIELKIVRLDTKRNGDEETVKEAARMAMAEIEAFGPDIIFASDDDAQKYLIVPNFIDSTMPVVFCCVNWDATEYGYPASNITGMIEVDLVVRMVEILRTYSEGDRIAYLSGDTSTDQKIVPIYNERFFDGQMQSVFVSTFDEFKEAFISLQDEVDILYFGNNAGIEGWDDAAAEAFIRENTRIPTGSRSDWMAPFVVVTLAKLGQEQGEWAGQTALNILDGTAVSEIPMTENKQGQLILNLDLADKLDIVFAPSLLRNAEIYGGEESN